MISLKNLITEGQHDYGCVMARVDEDISTKILDFNCNLIGEDVLFVEGDEYGRENTPHVTIKFGLTESYSQEQMQEMLREVTPIVMEIRGISIFECDKFDVVKFDIDGSDLRKLNEFFSKLPNEDSHPVYHPHMTLAYVQKGNGKNFVRSPRRFANVTSRMIEYSDKGMKSYYVL